jgi:hypothetical protein
VAETVLDKLMGKVAWYGVSKLANIGTVATDVGAVGKLVIVVQF